MQIHLHSKDILYVVALVQDLASLIDKEAKQHPRDTNKGTVDASPVHMKGSPATHRRGGSFQSEGGKVKQLEGA